MIVIAQGVDKYKLAPSSDLIFALEDYDLTFYPVEVEKVRKLWNFGWSVELIAYQVKRHKYEIAVLIFHLLKNKRIKPREEGVVVF